MNKRLQMVFLNTDGRNVNISVVDPKDTLTEIDVEELMNSIITTNIFQTTGGNIVSKVRAQIISREVDTIAEF